MQLTSVKSGSFSELGVFVETGQAFAVALIDTGNKQIVVNGDASFLTAGEHIVVWGGSYDHGPYTVVSAVYSSGQTTITVAETPTESLASGFVCRTAVPTPDDITEVSGGVSIGDVPDGAVLCQITGGSTVSGYGTIHITSHIESGSSIQLSSGEVLFAGPSSFNAGTVTGTAVFAGEGSYNDSAGQVVGDSRFSGSSSYNAGTLNGSHHHFLPGSHSSQGGAVYGTAHLYQNTALNSGSSWEYVNLMVAGIGVGGLDAVTAVSVTCDSSIAPDPADVRRGVPYNQTVGAMPASVLRLIPN